MNTRVTPILLLLLCLHGAVGSAQSCICNECPQAATQLNTTNITFELDGAVFNDLSDPSQGICEVVVNFAAEHIWSIEMTLTSPAGQSINIIGPNVNQFGLTGPLPWEIHFVPCGTAANPDLGFNDTWNNNQSWTAGSLYDGSYYPFTGCLEDFNTGTVDGIWTLEVTNNSPVNSATILDFQIIPCTTSGIECFGCSPVAGVLEDIAPSTPCAFEEIPFDVDFAGAEPDSNQYGYSFIVAEYDTIISIVDSLNVSMLGPGTYEICGLSYSLVDSLSLPVLANDPLLSDFQASLASIFNVFCAEITDECLTLEVIGFDTTYIADSFCEGDSYDFDGSQIDVGGIYPREYTTSIGCDSVVVLDLTMHPIKDTSFTVNLCEGQAIVLGTDTLTVNGNYSWQGSTVFGCDSLVNLNLIFEEPVETIIDSVICQGEEVTIGNVSYNSTGEYNLTLSTASPCDSLVTLKLTVLEPVPIIDNPIFLDCSTSPLVLDASGSLGENLRYEWVDLDNGGAGIQGSNTDSVVLVVLGGQYELILIDTLSGVSCKTSSITSVVANFVLPAAVVNMPTISCLNPMVSPDVIPTSTISNFLWSGPDGFISTEQEPSFSIPGFYQLTIQGANGCLDSNIYELTADTLAPIITSIDFDTLDCDSPTAKIAVVTQPENITIFWNGPGGFSAFQKAITVSESGDYSTIIIGPNGCSVDTFVSIIELNDPPIFGYTATTFDCNTPLGEIQVFPSESDYTFQWEGPLGFTSTQEIITNIVSGAYSLTVTNSLGCDSIVQILPPVDSIPPIFSLEGANLSCDTTEVELSIIDLSVIDNYIWSGPTGSIDVTSSIIVENAGWYFATAIAANGCENIDSIFVDQDADVPIIVLDNDTLTCVESVLNLTASINSPIVDFFWSGLGTFATNELNPEISEPGFYTLTANGVNGCSSSATLEIISDTILPAINIFDDSLTCVRNSISLIPNVVGLVSYEWQQDGFFISNEDSILITAPGIYTVEVTSSNGCISRDTAIITSNIDLPSISNFNAVVNCYHPIVHLGDSLADLNWTFEWSGPGIGISNDPIIAANEAGTYFLNITALNGCQSNYPFEVIIDTLSEPVFQNDFTLDCLNPEQALAFLVPGQAVDSVVWTFPSGSKVDGLLVTSAEVGLHIMSVTYMNGCTSEASFTGFVDTIPISFDIEGPVINCLIPNPTIHFNAIDAFSSVSWSGPNLFSSSELNPAISDPGIYTLELTGLNSCIAIDSVEVEAFLDQPTIQLAGDTLTCFEPSINIDLITSNNTVVNWTGPSSFMSSDVQPLISDAGMYEVTVVDTFSKCQEIGNVLIVADTITPQFVISNGELNCGDSILTLSPMSVNANWEYFWTDENGLTQNMPTIDVGLSGIYVLEVEGENGCRNIDSLIVSANDSIPNLTVSAGRITCSTPSVNVSVSSNLLGNTYVWTDPNGNTIVGADFMTLEPGIFELTASALNGCSATTAIEVQADTISPDIELESVMLDCGTQEEWVVFEHGIDIAEVVWFTPLGDTIAADSILVSSSGNYIVEVSGANGCISIDSFLVAVNSDAPSYLIEEDTLNCLTDTLLLPLTILSNTDSISWSGPNGFTSSIEQPIISEGGQYSFILVGENGCAVSDLVNIRVDTLVPIVNVFSDTLTCEANSTVIGLTNPSPYWHFEWTGAGVNGELTDSVQVSAAGVYAVNIIFENGCTSQRSITVVADEAVPQLTIPDTLIDCNFPAVELFAISDAPLESTTWLSGTAIISTDSSVTFSEAGAYTLNIIAENGCANQADFNVIEDRGEPIAIINVDTFSCLENEVTLDISLDGSFASAFLQGPNGFASSELDTFVSAAGQYMLNVIGENGCVLDTLFDVAADTIAPSIIVSANEIDCSVDSVVPVVLGIFDSIAWSGPNGFESVETEPAIFQSGLYQVEAFGENGCSNEFALIVMQDSLIPVFSIDAEEINCLSAISNVSLFSTSPSDSITWIDQNGVMSFSNQFQTNSGGWIDVVVTAENGCEKIDSVFIVENMISPSVDLIMDTLNCQGVPGILQATNGAAIQSYYWIQGLDTLGTDSTFSSLIAGIYNLEIIGDNYCAASYELELFPPDIPVVPAISYSNPLTCVDLSADLVADVSNLNPALNFYWTDLSGAQVNNDSLICTTSGYYNFHVINSNTACSNLDSILVPSDTLSPIIEIVPINGLNISCDTSTLVMNALVSIPDGELVWTFEGDTIATDIMSIEIQSDGEFGISVVNPSNGCGSTDEVVVSQDVEVPEFDISETSELNCYEPNGIIELSPVSPIDYQVEWSIGSVDLLSGINEWSLPINSAGTYSILMQNPDNGCSKMDSIIVTSNFDQPSFEVLQSDTLDCITEQISLAIDYSESPEINYQWLSGLDTIMTNGEVEINAPGTIILAVQNLENGCEKALSHTIEVGNLGPQSLEVEIVQPSCLGDNDGSILIDTIEGGIAPFEYIFDGADVEDSEMFDLLDPGTYTLEVFDADGCSHQKEIEIIAPDSLTVELGPNIYIDLGETVDLIPEIQGSYDSIIWIGEVPCASCLENFVQPLVSSQYLIETMDEKGCKAEDRISIFVKSDIGVFIPNAFSPNGDGSNDFFYPQFTAAVEQVNKMSIFSRWGERVFSVENQNPESDLLKWNGQYRGQLLNSGVFIYTIEVTKINGERVQQSGDLSLIR